MVGGLVVVEWLGRGEGSLCSGGVGLGIIFVCGGAV